MSIPTFYWPYLPYGPCPCQSGKKAKFCCRKGAKWVTKPKWVPSEVLPPKTGSNHPKCIAAGAGRCDPDGKISREHLIPRGVLSLISKEILVRGLGPERVVTLNNLTAKVLCKAHNERLSPLDSTLKTLLEKLQEHVKKVSRGEEELLLLNGDDVEFALLRMAWCLVESGALETPLSVNPKWKSVLYGEESWPSRWGLYVKKNGVGVDHGPPFGRILIGLSADEGHLCQLNLKFGPWLLSLHVGNSNPPSPFEFQLRPDILVTQLGLVDPLLMQPKTYSGIHFTYTHTPHGGWVRETIEVLRL